ncbi:uncharacterized protein LOC135829475 [Sycon ciliatum]|uniref:uncharacterized protein LOC135829475 n=1 Tax=Sycon ciliatum TaxID=27933 RepID=UPI0031F629EB
MKQGGGHNTQLEKLKKSVTTALEAEKLCELSLCERFIVSYPTAECHTGHDVTTETGKLAGELSQRQELCYFIPVHGHDPMYKQPQRVPMRAGSLLIWDQRVAHGSRPNNSTRARYVQFVKMFQSINLRSERAKNRGQLIKNKVELAVWARSCLPSRHGHPRTRRCPAPRLRKRHKLRVRMALCTFTVECLVLCVCLNHVHPLMGV